MKKLLIFISIFFIVGQSISKPINFGYQNTSSDNDKTVIVLINPGVFYLKSIVYMTENGIINVENIEYQAVFYTKSEVRIRDAKDFVKSNGIKYIKFREVYGNLDINNIYKKNLCSDDFLDIVNTSDGIIFLGGWDIPPVYYGQKTELTVGINTPNRHLFELSFYFHLLGGSQNLGFKNLLEDKPYFPVLGICLGMQTMNVATGGDMYQDIPSDVYGLNYVEDVISLGMDQMHRNYNKNLFPEEEINNHSFHHVKITDKNLRRNLKLKNGFNPITASSHHQAVKDLGKNMVVAGTSMDGKVIEAMVHKKYINVIGTQFHPEFIYLYDPDSKRRKFNIDDEELLSEHEVLVKNDSYQFHLDFWENFINSVKLYSDISKNN